MHAALVVALAVSAYFIGVVVLEVMLAHLEVQVLEAAVVAQQYYKKLMVQIYVQPPEVVAVVALEIILMDI
jgi:hypothetical protein